MKFSVCTPVTFDVGSPDNRRMPRYDMFLRCAGSLAGQTYKDFEWVIADDLSTPPVSREMIPQVPAVNIVRLPEKSGRLVARNAAMKAAQGEWLCWLDADDEYASEYLRLINDAITLYPEYKVFNFNHLVFSYDFKVYERKFINMDVQGDKPFRAGTVGAGSFVFHRSVLEDIGLLPEMGLWQFSEDFLNRHPEVKPFYWNEGKKAYDSLGNPWGEDYAYFYEITRKYKSKYLDAPLYFVHPRWGHKWPEDPTYVVDPGKKPEWNKSNQ